MSGPKATPEQRPRPRGKRRALLAAVDYTLAKRALLRDFRGGILSRFDVCDAHPELLRAARLPRHFRPPAAYAPYRRLG